MDTKSKKCVATGADKMYVLKANNWNLENTKIFHCLMNSVFTCVKFVIEIVGLKAQSY